MVIHRRLRTLSSLALVATVLFNSGCAMLGSKSNDDVMSKFAGEDFVISVPAKTIDLNRLTGESRQDQSIFRLVDEKHYKLAYQSNGNRLAPALQLNDPSTAILNSLNKYFANKYQLRFIAKGTINNIDPDFIASKLSKGDYVIDVRVSEFKLIPNESNQFYPQAAFRFTVVDRQKAKNQILDECRFAEPQNANNIRYFAANNGAQLSAFLQRNASACLQYFAQGKPLPVAQAAKPKGPPVVNRVAQPTLTRVGLNSQWAYYPRYQNDSATLWGYALSASVVNRLSPTFGFEMQTRAKVSTLDALPTFAPGTVYGGTLGFGVNWMPSGETANGYGLLVKGQLGQFRQNAIWLSTNSVGVSVTAYRKLLADLQIQAEYTYWQHLGLTQESNVEGHELGVTLQYQFD